MNNRLLGNLVIVSLIALMLIVTMFMGLAVREADRIAQRVLNLEQAAGIERVENVTVTAYSPRVRETDDTPFITASNARVAEGTIAVSRDLWLAGWAFGKKVFIECAPGKKGRRESKAGLCGIFIIQDAMNRRFTKRIDIFIHNTAKALAAGKRERVVVLQSL